MKPKVIYHMMSSVNGRVVGNRWSLPFDAKIREDLFEPYYQKDREFNIRTFIIGRNTVHTDFG